MKAFFNVFQHFLDYAVNLLTENDLQKHQKWKEKKSLVAALPVSPYSPKMFRKTSASVPLPFMSAVNTLTMYLFTAKHDM